EHVPGKLQEELPKDEDRGRVDGEWQDHAQEAVAKPEVASDQYVERDHQQLERHNQQQQQQVEDRLPAAKMKLGERVPGEHPKYERTKQHTTGEEDGVQQ